MFSAVLKILFASTLVLGTSCVRDVSPTVTDKPVTVTPTPYIIASPTTVNGSTPSKSALNEKQSDYKGYHYFYKQDGDKTVALFAKRFLPRDDTIVVGAIRDVIRKAYKEETYGEPYVQNTTAGGTAVRGIRVDGSKHGYVVVPVKEDSGEINSLTITQVALR